MPQNRKHDFHKKNSAALQIKQTIPQNKRKTQSTQSQWKSYQRTKIKIIEIENRNEKEP